MTEYTRVTVQGEGRKADLVLPDDEPVAAMLPDVLSLLREDRDRSARPVVLVTTVGEQLDPSLTLAEQAVGHGTLLRVVRMDEAPPPPEVADVTDVAADAVAARGDVWRPVWGLVAAAALTLLLGAGGATVARSGLGVDAGTPGWLVAALVAVAIGLGRRGRTAAAVVQAAAAVGAAVVVADDAAGRLADGTTAEVGLVWFVLTCVVVGLVATVGFADAALGLGGAVGVVLAGTLAAGEVLGWERPHTAAVVAVVGCLVVGLLPGLAMTVSGLSGLDDRVVEGRRVPRAAAERAVDAAHRGLTWATVAAALVTGACAWLLADVQDTWSRLLAVAVAAVLLLRTRVLPLAPQRLALLVGGATPLVVLLLDLGRDDPGRAVVVVAALVVGLAVVTGTRTSDQVRARLRRLADVAELVAVLALVPLVLAHLGVFADLVDAF